MFNDKNYWLNLRGANLTRRGKNLDITNRVKWLALVQDITNKEDKAKEKEARRGPEMVGIGLMKMARKEEEDEVEEEAEETLKRPFDVMYSWVSQLDIPRDSYDLMYRLGQKTERYFETKVEYYAPYLLKDGMVQRMTQYETNAPDAEEVRTFVKYRNRADRLIGKVVEKAEGKLTEKFEMGRWVVHDHLHHHRHHHYRHNHHHHYHRQDRLEQLTYLREMGDEVETVKVEIIFLILFFAHSLTILQGVHVLPQVSQGRSCHTRVPGMGDHRHVYWTRGLPR